MAKKLSRTERVPVPVHLIERRIYLISGQKVMLDADLAELYRVATFRLNEAVKRNHERFPKDFMFQLTAEETDAFTEHGGAMLSSVLNGPRAVQMSIVIIRAFVRLRGLLATHKALARRIEQLEATQQEHGSNIVAVVEEIKKRKQPPRRPKTRIGFYTGQK
ncbi:MAG: hypothetical protein DMG57_06115 [Acidobacteria bacterium]|nr:MAG: hypothetical protein DMG57_06115 [Acidobacteriota bacterium]